MPGFSTKTPCVVNPTFRCEEHMYRPTLENDYRIDSGDSPYKSFFHYATHIKRTYVWINGSIIRANLLEKCY
jgi:hypothetical protein